MASVAMDEEKKTWWTLELLMSELSIPYSLLDSLLQFLLSPPSPSPSPSSSSSPPLAPPQIRRVLLLRHLLYLTTADHPLDALETLKTLDLLLPQPPSPPPPSLCKAYVSLLFYFSLSPAVPTSDSVNSIDQIKSYEFSAEILRPLDGMLKAVDRAADCVAVAGENAIRAVKEFVEEQFRIVGPPFLLRAAEAYLKEQNEKGSEAEAFLREQSKNRSEAEAFVREQNESRSEAAHTSSLREDSQENQDMSKEKEEEKYRMAVRKRKISEINAEENQESTIKEKGKHQMCLRKRKISQVNLEANQDIPGKKNKSNGENSTEKDGTGTDCAGTEPINLPETNELNTEENSERTEKRDQENNRGKNVNDPSTPRAHDTNRKKKRSLIDRNPIEGASKEMEISSPRPKRRSSRPKWRASDEPEIKKSIRPKRKWTESEVNALIKGVNEIGFGKWQRILEEFGEEFDGRNYVDLKDKWRNLGPYLLKVGEKWSVLSSR